MLVNERLSTDGSGEKRWTGKMNEMGDDKGLRGSPMYLCVVLMDYSNDGEGCCTVIYRVGQQK